MSETRQIDGLITEFGKIIGIEELVLDDENRCILEFDNQVVSFQYSEEHGVIILFSELGKVPDSNAPYLYKELLAANFYREKLVNSALSYHPETDTMVLILHKSVDGLDIRQFDGLVDNFVNVAIAWTQRIKQAWEEEGKKPAADNNNQANWISV